LVKNGDFDFGYAPADFVPARDSPDKNTYECSEINTASKLIDVFNFYEDNSDFIPARDSQDDDSFNFGIDISSVFALKCGKVPQTCFMYLFLYCFLFLCSATWSHNEAWEGIETILRSILRFDLFYVECQITKFSGWIFGQSLSDQHSETTPNSVCPIFWKSACEFVLRTTQREHDHNLVSYLVYLRYLQVLLDLRRTTTLLRYLQVPVYKYRYFSIYEEQLNDTVYRRERYGFTFYSDIVRELSTYRYSRLFSPEVFIVLTLLNSWFSSYSLARRIYYLIHASFYGAFIISKCTDLFMPSLVFWYIN
jgi:hypothetical protein